MGQNVKIGSIEFPAEILPRAFEWAVGFGLLNQAGYSRVTALGNNPSVDTGTVPEDIWTGGGVYPWMTAATALEVVSDNVNDTAAGTGARTVSLSGLNISYVPVVQTLTLNGTTPVAVPTDLLRINSMVIMSAGTGKVNAGALHVRDAGGGTVRAIIQAGYGITRQSIFTVPAGFTLQINSSVFCINRPSSQRDCAISTFFQSPNGFYRMPLEISVDGNPYRHDGVPGIVVPEKNDFCFRATSVSANGTDITAGFLGIMKNNSFG